MSVVCLMTYTNTLGFLIKIKKKNKRIFNKIWKFGNLDHTVADYRPSTVILKEVLPLKVNTFKL